MRVISSRFSPTAANERRVTMATLASLSLFSVLM